MVKPITRDQQTLMREVYTYTSGQSCLTKVELQQKRAEASADPDLKGRLREGVLARYRDLIASARR